MVVSSCGWEEHAKEEAEADADAEEVCAVTGRLRRGRQSWGSDMDGDIVT